MINSSKLLPNRGTITLSKGSVKKLAVTERKLILIDSLLKQKLILSKVRDGIRRQEEERIRMRQQEINLEDDKKDDDPDSEKSKRKKPKDPKDGGGFSFLNLLSIMGLTAIPLSLLNNPRIFNTAANITAGVLIGTVVVGSAIVKSMNAIDSLKKSLKSFGPAGVLASKTVNLFLHTLKNFVTISILAGVANSIPGFGLFKKNLIKKIKNPRLKSQSVGSNTIKKFTKVKEAVKEVAIPKINQLKKFFDFETAADFAKRTGRPFPNVAVTGENFVKQRNVTRIAKEFGQNVNQFGRKVIDLNADRAVVRRTAAGRFIRGTGTIAKRNQKVLRRVLKTTVSGVKQGQAPRLALKLAIKPYAKTISKIFGRIPIFGAILDFVFQKFVFGLPVPKAAFVAAASTLGGSIGGFLGTLIGGPVGAILLSMLGGAIFDRLGLTIYNRVIEPFAIRRAERTGAKAFDTLMDINAKRKAAAGEMRRKLVEQRIADMLDPESAYSRQLDDLFLFNIGKEMRRLGFDAETKNIKTLGRLYDLATDADMGVETFMTKEQMRILLDSKEYGLKLLKNKKALEVLSRLEQTPKPIKKIVNPNIFKRTIKNLNLSGGGSIPDIGSFASYENPRGRVAVKTILLPLNSESDESNEAIVTPMGGSSRVSRYEKLYKGGLA
jgi:hypothetical protein